MAVKNSGAIMQTKVTVGRSKTSASLPNSWESLLAGISTGKTALEVGMNRNIFLQGERADSVYYLKDGAVKLAVTSEEGKDAIFAIVEAGELFGQGCLVGQHVRAGAAQALTDCTLVRIDRMVMMSLLHEQHAASELLVMSLLRKTIRYEEDLVDHLCNSSEQRLARSLLLLAHVGREGKTEAVGTKVNQETLAQMVGTTRSRVSHFMNKFRERGLVDYNGRGELMVTNKLLDVANNFSTFPSSSMAA
jgi:CRP/FNR family transcriptional regulator, cyclic AMP receptor protein